MRFAAGVGGGVSFRFSVLQRTLGGGLFDSTTATASGVAPAGTAHVSLLLGSTPGAKLELGVVGIFETHEQRTPPLQRGLAGANVTMSVPAYDILSGPQLAIGPFLGVRFGH